MTRRLSPVRGIRPASGAGGSDETTGVAAAETVRFEADRGDARLRLDQMLVRRIRHVSRLSRRQVQRWIESGAVAVDGRPASRSAARLREGAEVTVAIPASAPRRVLPQAEYGALEVLYEDDELMAVNKPAGLVVHPSYKRTSGTLLNAVLWRVRNRPTARPGILTRLDKDTSGLVIVALTGLAHAAMQRDAAAGRCRKEYLALVRGVPAPRSGRILHPLARDPRDRRRVAVTPGGAPCETRYEVVASRAEDQAHGGGPISLVRCELVTGRTHQIRVHLAFNGWPILGDATYGEPHPALPRQALHAWRLSLPHPVSRLPLVLVAPLSDDLRRVGPVSEPDAVQQLDVAPPLGHELLDE